MFSRCTIFVVCVLLLAPGCGQWKASPKKDTWKLATPRLSPDTVVLEVAFLRVKPSNASEADQIWKETDEQIMPPEQRRNLQQNGLRCGVVSSQMPVSLQRLLDERPKSTNIATQDFEQLQEDTSTRQYRLQSREGVRSPVAAGKICDVLHVLLNDHGIKGTTYQDAQCLFGIRTYPRGDGHVRVEITPEIEHGQPRNHRIATEGMWRIDFRKDREEFEALRMESVLAPGQIMIVSCTPEAVGLGGCIFSKSDQETTVLLIRLAQTQLDDLFREDEKLVPIATQAE